MICGMISTQVLDAAWGLLLLTLSRNDTIVLILINVFFILLMILWCISVVKHLIIPNWDKIKEVTLGILGGIGVLIGFIFMVWLFFHDCSGCESHHDIDHVHYERY